jgi:hypothetical protein
LSLILASLMCCAGLGSFLMLRWWRKRQQRRATRGVPRDLAPEEVSSVTIDRQVQLDN